MSRGTEFVGMPPTASIESRLPAGSMAEVAFDEIMIDDAVVTVTCTSSEMAEALFNELIKRSLPEGTAMGSVDGR